MSNPIPLTDEEKEIIKMRESMGTISGYDHTETTGYDPNESSYHTYTDDGGYSNEHNVTNYGNYESSYDETANKHLAPTQDMMKDIANGLKEASNKSKKEASNK